MTALLRRQGLRWSKKLPRTGSRRRRQTAAIATVAAVAVVLAAGAQAADAQAIDACLIGHWQAIKVTYLPGYVKGGKGFRVAFAPDGTETVDYASMAALEGGADTVAYSGHATARISTQANAATLERLDKADVTVRIATATGARFDHTVPGLGPGGLGSTKDANAYTCTEDWLEYRTSTAADGHANHLVRLWRLTPNGKPIPREDDETTTAAAATPSTRSRPPSPEEASQPPSPPTTQEAAAPPPQPAAQPTDRKEPPPVGDTAPPRPVATVSPPADCPYRGKGCVALIIDYSRGAGEDNLEAFSQTLAKGCVVDYVAPEFWETPAAKTVTALNANDPKQTKQITIPPDPEAVKRIAAHNDAGIKAIQTAVDRHRARVAMGVELAIEIIKGHGTNADPCGVVGPKTVEADIPRATFHENTYKAVKGKVCGWFVADLSCASGLNPDVVDHLDNTGAGACKNPRVSANQCASHAAYDVDIAAGSATSGSVCTVGTTIALVKRLTAALQPSQSLSEWEPLTPKAILDGLRRAAPEFASHYIDQGTRLCNPHSRKGY